MNEQEKRKNVIKGLECCLGSDSCAKCNFFEYKMDCSWHLKYEALELLKAQEQRHRLEVHNIGNVDIPENVTEKQFHAVMNNVVAALEHTDKGESWPYDEEGR